MPPSFGYYAPQPPHAHRRPPTNSLHPTQPQPQQITQQPASVEHNPTPQANAQDEEGAGTSEFGGLAAYFSSQQELD